MQYSTAYFIIIQLQVEIQVHCGTALQFLGISGLNTLRTKSTSPVSSPTDTTPLHPSLSSHTTDGAALPVAAAMQFLLPLLLLLSITLPSHGHTPAAAITAPAPAAPSPPASVIALMSKKGCKLFADLLTATADTATTYQQNVGSGLTVFCPNDAAVKAFAPKFKNLTTDAKVSLLLYQAIPVYNSIPMLKSGNGVVNTLATDGTSKNYNFTVQNEGETVTLNTGVSKADISGTIVDADPLAAYVIDTVLEPRELFKPAHAPAPAPSPEADAPVADKGAASPPAPTPAGPQSEPADKKKPADEKSGVASKAAGWRAAAAAAIAATLVLMTV